MREPRDIILKPIVTEKTNEQMAEGRYTFKVDPRANKIEIKHAVQTIFQVTVKDVNTMRVPGKPKRMGVHVGHTSEWKKAIVTLAKDSKPIKFFEGL
jgi:large subunit ribosomal protein L23